MIINLAVRKCGQAAVWSKDDCRAIEQLLRDRPGDNRMVFSNQHNDHVIYGNLPKRKYSLGRYAQD